MVKKEYETAYDLIQDSLRGYTFRYLPLNKIGKVTRIKFAAGRATFDFKTQDQNSGKTHTLALGNLEKLVIIKSKTRKNQNKTF